MYKYRQFPENQFYPGFPFFPASSPSNGTSLRPRDLELRVVQLERLTQRQGEEIERITRRLVRLERQLGFGIGGPLY